ncbi:hypothetical protein JKP88DRAFT_332825 [Tribonema minus]|uniref:Uncharacterized protein n=1 Tax=Tribonema minus TaxID=303371 RepID=A0A835YLT4_9STRA|nr:hypothetical protein JKP88DRAFT_332825 [Tribonema minus]
MRTALELALSCGVACVLFRCGSVAAARALPTLDAELQDRFALPPSASATEQWANAHIERMRAHYPPDRLFENSLKLRGEVTDLQLEPFFRKCVTPGSAVRVGAIGGSITHAPTSYVWSLGALLGEMCPHANVTALNGARSSHGALTLGLCARAVTHAALDVAVAEFALNDLGQYTRAEGAFRGQFSALPYELMMRNAFTHESAQEAHEEVGRRYGVTGLSLRDLVWPYFTAKRAPYAARGDVCSDLHHPNAQFQHFTAELVLLYIAERFVEWATRVRSGEASNATRGLAPLALPPPLHPELERFDLTHGGFECALVGAPSIKMPGRLPEMPVMSGWRVTEFPQCIQRHLYAYLSFCELFCTLHIHRVFEPARGPERTLPPRGAAPAAHAVDTVASTRKTGETCAQITDLRKASAFLPVHTEQGVVMLSNCFRPGPPAMPKDHGPAFNLNLLVGDAPPYRRLPLELVSVLAGNYETFQVEPPLPAGNHTLEQRSDPGLCPDTFETAGASRARRRRRVHPCCSSARRYEGLALCSPTARTAVTLGQTLLRRSAPAKQILLMSLASPAAAARHRHGSGFARAEVVRTTRLQLRSKTRVDVMPMERLLQ